MTAENRTTRAVSNVIAGLINKTVASIFPFIVRTIIMYVLGEEFLGLNSLFSSILQILNLADLGINEAVVYCLYKPIGNNDYGKIREYLSFYRKACVIIGIVILTAGAGCIPFLPSLIAGGFPDKINIYIVYTVFLMNTVFSYWFCAYKNVLLTAYQKNSIISNIHTGIVTAQNVIQILVLLIARDYYQYVVLLPVFTIICNIVTGHVADSIYPDLHPDGMIAKEELTVIRRMLGSLVLGRVADSFRNALDSIVLTSILGLAAAARYGNYYVIFSTLYGVFLIVARAVQAGVGDSIVTETVDKNFKDFKKVSFGFFWLIINFSACMFMLYQPVMKLWAGKKSLLADRDMLFFCIYFFFLSTAGVGNLYLNGSGLWREARFWFLMEAVSNCILNIILGRFLGISGILVSTIITVAAFNLIGRMSTVYKFYFKKMCFTKYIIDNMCYFVVLMIDFIILELIAGHMYVIHPFIDMMFRGIAAFTVTNILVTGIYYKKVYLILLHIRKRKNKQA